MKTLLQEIRKRGRPLVASLAMCCASAWTYAETVDLDVRSSHWSIIREATPTLRWDYPFGANSAMISVKDIQGKVVFERSFDSPVTSCKWTAFTGDVPESDTVFTCTISFDDGSCQTARVALLRSVFEGVTKVRMSLDGTSWTKVKRDVVIPYDAAWMSEKSNPSLTIAQKNGTKSISEDFDAPAGFYGWSSKVDKMGPGWFDLTLVAGNSELKAELNRMFEGLFMVVK